MTHLDSELSRRLETIRAEGLLRRLRRVETPQSPRIEAQGRSLLNFSSNDYLGLANSPELKEAAVAAVERFGAGSGASRLICGSLAVHHELEQLLAEFKQTAAAVGFSSGYAAAVGTICALLSKEDIIVVDRLVHACVIDAARLCGARLLVYAHNDVEELETVLKRTLARASSGERKPGVLIVTESVFSMDGDLAPLKEIVELKEKYGAWLMVDEAHATGLYGANGRGRAASCGISDRIEIQMGTLGKALGAAGGFVCGSRTLIDYIVNRARSFIFSTAPVPAATGAAMAAIRLVQSPEGEAQRQALWQRVEQLRAGANLDRTAGASAIVPIHLGDEARAVQVAATLLQQGFFVPAIRYPTVGRGQARLRVTLSAAHTAGEVDGLIAALRSVSAHSPALTAEP